MEKKQIEIEVMVFLLAVFGMFLILLYFSVLTKGTLPLISYCGIYCLNLQMITNLDLCMNKFILSSACH